MRVQFTAPLTVTDNYGLKQRGELMVSVAGLIYQPTQFIDPNHDPATGSNSTGNLATIEACQTANDGKNLVLDDGCSTTNPAPTPYLGPPLPHRTRGQHPDQHERHSGLRHRLLVCPAGLGERSEPNDGSWHLRFCERW